VTAAKWLVLTWRLPAASSTPRVATWRSLQRLGAVTLTPGAAVVPFTEDLLEQLEWIAEDIVQRGGEAYVLPVTDLREADEAEIRRRMRAERKAEFGELRDAADRLARSALDRPRYERELATLERGLARAIERDHFMSAARGSAERAIRLAGKRKEH
jgi:ChrB-like protein